MPGDIPLEGIISMLEKGGAVVSFSRNYKQKLNRKAAKSFKAMILGRERAVMKERTKNEIKREL